MTSLLSLNKTYTMTPPRALNPDTGGVEATDGLIGPYPDFTDAKWFGWRRDEGVTLVTCTIDLGTEFATLEYVRFHYVHIASLAMDVPAQAAISGSLDNSTWVALGTYTTAGGLLTIADNSANWTSNLPAVGNYRYVKFEITLAAPSSEGLKISEFEVYGTEITPSWTTPITDRAQSDIDNLTAKAYMNAADWQRIYIDAYFMSQIIGTTFDFVTLPSVTGFPTITGLNNLCHNIERLRQALPLAGLTPIKYTWLEGINKTTPNFTNVNQWESTLLALEQYFVKRKPQTGVAGAARGLTRNNGFRS
jgi:hypothetical protein